MLPFAPAHALAFLATLLAQRPSSAKDFILCERDAEIHAVQAVRDAGDACTGSAVIQGMSYRCTTVDQVARLTAEFLRRLQIEGRAACERHCKERGKGCVADFDTPLQCGFAVEKDQAESVGKNAPCNPACGGTALAYCSIIHASYLRFDPELFVGKTPNCRCRLKD